MKFICHTSNILIAKNIYSVGNPHFPALVLAIPEFGKVLVSTGTTKALSVVKGSKDFMSSSLGRECTPRINIRIQPCSVVTN